VTNKELGDGACAAGWAEGGPDSGIIALRLAWCTSRSIFDRRVEEEERACRRRRCGRSRALLHVGSEHHKRKSGIREKVESVAKFDMNYGDI
jgi:hypothetical protein